MHIVETAEQTYRPSTILGLRKRNFWILVAVLLVAVGPALGGSLGVALAVRNAVYRVFRKTYGTATYCIHLKRRRPAHSQTRHPLPVQTQHAHLYEQVQHIRPLGPSVVSLIDNLCPDTPTFPSFNDDTYNCTHGRDASAMHIPTSAQRLHIRFDSASLHAVW
jgi:hypothetical protein